MGIINHNKKEGGTMAKVAVKTEAKKVLRTKTGTEKPKDNRTECKALIETINQSWFKFDQKVADVYHNEEYRAWGFETFADACKAEWGMGYRTAMNHVQVGDAIKKFGITEDRIAGIGWTNFMEASALFDPEMKKADIDGTLKKVAKMTHDEVVRYKQEIRHKKAPIGTRVKMTFQFLDEQATVVMDAISKAKELMGVEHDDLALEYILVEWMSSHSTEAKVVNKFKSKLKGEVEEAVEEDDDEEEVKPQRKQRVDKGKTKKVVEEEEDEDEDEDEDEEPAPKSKAKSKAKTAKKVVEEDEDEDDEDDDDDDLLGDE